VAERFDMSKNGVYKIATRMTRADVDYDPDWRRPVEHGNARLIREDVLAIREEYEAGGTSYERLGTKYGLSSSSVCDIIKRKTYKHM
jgi:Mor family transcriptional regulator